MNDGKVRIITGTERKQVSSCAATTIQGSCAQQSKGPIRNIRNGRASELAPLKRHKIIWNGKFCAQQEFLTPSDDFHTCHEERVPTAAFTLEGTKATVLKFIATMHLICGIVSRSVFHCGNSIVFAMPHWKEMATEQRTILLSHTDPLVASFRQAVGCVLIDFQLETILFYWLLLIKLSEYLRCYPAQTARTMSQLFSLNFVANGTCSNIWSGYQCKISFQREWATVLPWTLCMREGFDTLAKIRMIKSELRWYGATFYANCDFVECTKVAAGFCKQVWYIFSMDVEKTFRWSVESPFGSTESRNPCSGFAIQSSYFSQKPEVSLFELAFSGAALHDTIDLVSEENPGLLESKLYEGGASHSVAECRARKIVSVLLNQPVFPRYFMCLQQGSLAAVQFYA